ncbi:MAG: hypothetical protein E7321_04780 [Clostridiales bacterium]|nr:hypothetical protein [Clostridiales bacterium]
MTKAFNRKKLSAFIQRRKINALGLTVITAASAIITLICALTGFNHTDILVMVTVALVALCFLQYFRNRKGFRTLHAFRGSRKKKTE